MADIYLPAVVHSTASCYHSLVTVYLLRIGAHVRGSTACYYSSPPSNGLGGSLLIKWDVGVDCSPRLRFHPTPSRSGCFLVRLGLPVSAAKLSGWRVISGGVGKTTRGII